MLRLTLVKPVRVARNRNPFPHDLLRAASWCPDLLAQALCGDLMGDCAALLDDRLQ